VSKQATTEVSDNPFLNIILEIVEEAGEREEFENAQQFHLKLRYPASNPLVIQSVPEKYPYMDEKRHIIVYHLMNIGGPKVGLPQVVMTDQGHPIELQTLERYYKIVSQGLSQRTEINQPLLVEAKAFLQQWAEEIRQHRANAGIHSIPASGTV
jgi:hypothetical protein